MISDFQRSVKPRRRWRTRTRLRKVWYTPSGECDDDNVNEVNDVKSLYIRHLLYLETSDLKVYRGPHDAIWGPEPTPPYLV
ncbi:hypothetical protein PoB_006856500 [Plakobranchus ocellatus]|uniref:Uncharacterized protein n=1 Tax=Plakobranchus ocellatus TaxID=259542 RepID=A0AAV4DDP5_9GAST|nr:hypothetical protein PoB_006856500 [Plakobranchus ocellatus]